MLRRLELENFKSWEKLEIDLKPITLIFGANSSGKTAILDSLLMLKQTAESMDRSRSLLLKNGYRDLGSYHEVIHRHEDRRPLGVRIGWSPSTQLGASLGPDTPLMEHIDYRAQWGLDADVRLNSLSYAAHGFGISLTHVEGEAYEGSLQFPIPPGAGSIKQQMRLPAPESCYGLPRIVAQLWPEWNLLEFGHQLELVLDDIRYLGPMRQPPERVYQWSGERPGNIGQEGSSTVEVLLADDRRAVAAIVGQEWGIVDETGLWLQRLGMAERFSVTPIDAAKRYYEVRVSVPGAGDVEAILPDVGFGVSQLLPVVVQMLFAPQGSTLLFEQPEIHLHPRAAAELADLFLVIAQQRDLQLIIETHSEYLLSRLQRRIAEAESELANPDSIAIYFCELREGASHLEPIRLNEYGHIENWPKDFFGDSIGDLRAMTEAMLERKRQGG